jgi:hypothetical protein
MPNPTSCPENKTCISLKTEDLVKKTFGYEICGSHDSDYEDCSLLGPHAVLSDTYNNA